ncbi:MAG: helix-turn-helix transcriptional regulator [Oscillospiraceae bacterium]|nr:helix-turn-helix transcriptional regulator [Oscillospiraceae bacterium]
MDQIKIGRFIAETRKSHHLTQRQLADALAISDKTVSKWECGKGLPEISLMLPLCNALNITVNDLLSGEKVSEVDYQKKAEENMMNLVKENEENKKRMALSVVCGIITVIAVCSLIVIAAYIAMPTIARIALILFALATAVVGIGSAAVLEIKAGYYECPHCHALFVPTMSEYVKGYHTLTRRKLKCHECGEISMCRHRIVR